MLPFDKGEELSFTEVLELGAYSIEDTVLKQDSDRPRELRLPSVKV